MIRMQGGPSSENSIGVMSDEKADLCESTLGYRSLITRPN